VTCLPQRSTVSPGPDQISGEPMAKAVTPNLGMILLFGACLAMPTGAGAQHFPPDEEVLLMLRYLVEDGKAEGIVVGFLEADGSTRILSHGDAGPGARPLGPRSVFEIGSIEKTFTATLLADMVMEGDVALQDPLSQYLPEGVTAPSFGGTAITLLDLATHRSGLPKNVNNHIPADPLNPYADLTSELIYQFISNDQLRRAPGAGFTYSNLGFQLLGLALARAAGESYSELDRERILTPLSMTSSGPGATPEPESAWPGRWTRFRAERSSSTAGTRTGSARSSGSTRKSVWASSG